MHLIGICHTPQHCSLPSCSSYEPGVLFSVETRGQKLRSALRVLHTQEILKDIDTEPGLANAACEMS